MKKKPWSRAASFLLAAALAVTSLPMQAFAEGGGKEGEDAVDWVNIADECVIDAPPEQENFPLSNLRDGDLRSEWRKSGDIANSSATLGFAFSSPREVKKVVLKFFASDSDLAQFPKRNLTIALQRDGSEVAGSKKQAVVNQTEDGGYEYVFSSPEEMTGFDLVLSEPRNAWDGEPTALFYPSIAEVEIYAAREAAPGAVPDDLENIAPACKPFSDTNGTWGALANINDGAVATSNQWCASAWNETGGKKSASVYLPIPDAKKVKRIALKWAEESLESATVDVRLENAQVVWRENKQGDYWACEPVNSEIISEKTGQSIEGGSYEVAFDTARSDLQFLSVTISNPSGTVSPRIAEVEIYAEKDAKELANVALAADVVAETNPPEEHEGHAASNLKDGDPGTIWVGNGSTWPATATLTFPSAKPVKKVVVKFEQVDDSVNRAVDVKLKSSGADAGDLEDVAGSERKSHSFYRDYVYEFETPQPLRRICAEIGNPTAKGAAGQFWPGLAEFEIYADGSVLVETVTVSCDKDEITVGEEITLRAAVEPDDADNKSVIWTSSDEAVAVVDANGKVTAVAEGTVTITATAADGGGKSGSVELTVISPRAQAVTVSAAGGVTELAVPKTLQMTAAVAPEELKDTPVQWSSSDDAIASVDANGLVTAKTAGNVTITATAKDAGKASGSYDLEVKWIPVTGISTDSDSFSLKLGESKQIEATVSPADASDPEVTWQSSAVAVAEVDEDGTVTAVSAGPAVITAAGRTETSVTKEISVTVEEPANKVTGITIEGEGNVHELAVPKELQLTATVLPENADVKTVTWSSGNSEIASVDQNGKVTAKKTGTVAITATARDGSGIAGTYNLTITWIPVADIELTSDVSEVTAGKSVKLSAAVSPADASNPGIVFSSSDETIATVDAQGNVKALKEGEVTITATAQDDTNTVAKTFKLTVKPPKTAKIDLSADSIGLSAKNATGHGIELAVDGKKDTFWQSIPSSGEGEDRMKNRMYDHDRYIDIKLDGTYDLTKINIFTKADGSFNNYYVYASEDGVNYDKIISKTSNSAATEEGDSYEINKTASYLRLNMAYNSNVYVTNLTEIEVWGAKVSEDVPEPAPISVTDWNDSDWKTEWDKFEANENGYADQKVIREMGNMAGRVVGEKWKDSFRFELRDSLEEGKDIFEIKDGENGVIVIRGNSGVAMASGFNYYLKNYVNVDYNPMYSSNTNIKEIVPVKKRVVKEAQFDLRYALNFCTYSYTMSFWNWDEYEKFLDWSAMNGINLILDIVGQEEVLRQTFAEFGYTDEEIKDYICGPAYFAWFYMQNLYSVGGPLPDSWFESRAELGRQIHDRMQTYGIDPVIQGFAGQVPDTFVDKNKGTILAPDCEWSGFTRPAIIKTYLSEEEKAAGAVDYYDRVADVFYEKQKNVFGDVSHYYAADPFHEGGVVGNLVKSDIYEAVQKKMLSVDPDAVWVMQQWQWNLDADRMSKLQLDHTLPLSLQADKKPEWHGIFEQNGAPWIYCMLHNFGGRMGLDGEIPKMSEAPIETFQASNHMVGIGMSPEAMENSPVVYELLFDTNWSADPIDYMAWTKKYGERRAGGSSDSLAEAWEILVETAYADRQEYTQGAAETVINARPSDNFNAASSWGNSSIRYDKKELDRALLLLVENYEAFRESPAYKYDLADVAEQVLCNAAVEYHKLMVQAKNARDIEEFTSLSTAFLELIDLSDEILATTDGFLLGTWIEASRKMISDADDWTKDLFEFNARSLVTTWAGERPCGPGGLRDYSNRKWAGLTKDFYRERWAIWIRNRMAELKNEPKDPADEKAESNWFLWESQWTNRKSDDEDGKYAYVTAPTDEDLGALAVRAYDDFSFTNLEKNTGGSTQEAVNVAKGKRVASQSQTADGDLQNITDGDTAAGWQAVGNGPHVVEIDLEKTYDVSGITLAIPQLAKIFPYTWKVEYYNSDTGEWALLKEDTSGSMSSNTYLTDPCTASKIRITMTTGDTVDSPLELMEVEVYAVEEEEEGDGLENLALGITPSATDKDGGDVGGAVERLTDGDASTLWSPVSWDNARYPVNIELDLGQDVYTEYADLQFESPGRPFAFSVTVTDASGASEKVSSEYEDIAEALEKGAYRIPIGRKVKKITVCIVRNTGAGQFGGSWPALSEIKVMGIPSASEQDLSGNLVTGIAVSGEAGATSKVLEDNKSKDLNDGSAYDKLNLGKEAVFDLGATYYLSHVNLVFEKAGLALKYQVYAEDADGNRELLEEYDSPANRLEDRVARVAVGREVKKIIFIHNGNGTQQETDSYLAEPRFYGFEAYGVEKSSVSAEQAEGLTGSAGNYQAAAGVPVVLALSRPAEVNMIKVVRASGETKALRYLAEYYDAQDGEWKLFADQTDEADASREESYAVVKKGVFTEKIRLIFNEGIRIGDIVVYNTDTLLRRVSQIESLLAGLAYDGSHGSYKAEAKEKLELVLEDAKEVTGGSPQIVNEWLDTLDRALDEFYKTGKLYMDRSGLLAAMLSVRELIGKYQPEGQDLADLEQIYAASRELYEQYGASQSQIDLAAAEQEERLYEIGIRTETQKNPELAAARTEMKTYLEGLEEKDSADYEPASWKAYIEAVAAANAVLLDWDTTSARITAVKDALTAAETALKRLVFVSEITIRADKTTWQAGEKVPLSADVLPADASNTSLKWTSDREEIASVDAEGLVTSHKDGEVKIRAMAKDGSGIFDEITLTFTPAKVSKITIRPAGGAHSLQKGGTLQLIADVSPDYAQNKEVTWSISEEEASIADVDADGLVTAKEVGEVTVTATAKDGSEVSGEIKLTVTDHVLVSEITVRAQDDKTTLKEGETVQLIADVLPENAGNKDVTWSVSDEEAAFASVNEDGLVTAISEGEVTVTATAKDGSGVSGEIALAVTKEDGGGDGPDDPVLAEEIIVRAAGNKTTLITGEKVRLSAEVLPEEAEEKAVTWTSGNEKAAVVDADGTVTAKAKGTAVITATAKDGGGASGKITLTIQEKAAPVPPAKVPVSSVTLKAARTMLAEGESVAITATVLPAKASNKGLTWISNNQASAVVDASGRVTAKAAGKAVITATAKDGSRKYGSIAFEILPKKGKTYKDKKLSYKITASTEKVRTVTVQKPLKSKDKKITIPATVMIKGYDYQVTAIAAKAFRNKKSLTQVIIGTNVATIGKQAFYNCKKLKTVTIKSSKIKKIDKQAFSKIVKKATITVPKKKYAAYKKLLKNKAKIAKTVKIKKAKK